MRNRAVTYFLLGTVLLVWGGIFFKVFATFFSQEKNVYKLPIRKTVETSVDYEMAVYSIKADYRDPFLGNSSSIVEEDFLKPASKPGKKRTKKIETKPVVAPVDWSFFKYLGLIKNSGNGKKIGLVSIRNQEVMIEEGREYDGLKCLKYYKDSIIVIYQGKRACIKK